MQDAASHGGATIGYGVLFNLAAARAAGRAFPEGIEPEDRVFVDAVLRELADLTAEIMPGECVSSFLADGCTVPGRQALGAAWE